MKEVQDENILLSAGKSYTKSFIQRAAVQGLVSLAFGPASWVGSGILVAHDAYSKYKTAKNTVNFMRKFIKGKKSDEPTSNGETYGKYFDRIASGRVHKHHQPLQQNVVRGVRILTSARGNPGQKRGYSNNPLGHNQHTRKRTHNMSSNTQNAGGGAGGNTPQQPQQAASSEPEPKRPKREQNPEQNIQIQSPLTGSIMPVNGYRKTHDTEMFSRTFKHYIEFGDQAGWTKNDQITNEWYMENKDWHYLPYNWLNAALSPRDYQAINIRYNNWHVKSFGFDIHHIVPFVDDLKSSGSSVAPTVEISPINYFELFIDFDHELPKINQNQDTLPNTSFSKLFDTRTKSTLSRATLKYEPIIEGADCLELENSDNFMTVDASDGFSYMHQVDPVDKQNMHSFWPVNIRRQANGQEVKDKYVFPVLGIRNIDSGDYNEKIGEQKKYDKIKDNQLSVASRNILWESMQFHAPRKPPPFVLLRVPRIDRKTDSPSPFAFSMLVTYYMEIEGTLNRTMPNAVKCAAPGFVNVFSKAELYQSSGGDSHRFITHDKEALGEDMK